MTEEEFAKRTLPLLRFVVCGSHKPPGRTQYLRLLHTQDGTFLRLLGEFGASSAVELADLANSARLKARFAWLAEPTVIDWMTTAERRGLVVSTDLEGEPRRWRATESGRLHAKGWRGRFVALFHSLMGFVKWLVPLALGGVVYGLLKEVDWKDVLESDASSVALVVGAYLVGIVVYVALMRFVQSISALLLIDLSRKAGEVLSMEVAVEAPAAP